MNNEARFGMSFAVKGAKQVQKTQDAINAKLRKMGVTAEQTSKKIEDIGKKSEETGNKQKRTLEDGTSKANELSKSLDRVVKKWLSIGGAITLVSRIIRKAFAKMDEVTGLKRMSQVAGVLPSRIESIGKKLKELYGADSSSAASAYTSVGDILGAARSGRGISQDVVAASARYGIALNGGMLTEDQLLTNIARAMQVQRKKGNMYGVREIADAFGIDDAMMLHLSERGANWDRGLPAANLAKMQEEAQKTKELQTKLDDMATKFINVVMPALLAGMEAIVKIAGIIEDKWGKKQKEKVENLPKDTAHASSYEEGLYQFNKSQGMSDYEARSHAKKTMLKAGYPTTVTDEFLAERVASAKAWADYYNKNSGMDVMKALANIRNIGGDSVSPNLVFDKGKLQIVIEDRAGALRDKNVTTKTQGFVAPMVINSTTGV